MSPLQPDLVLTEGNCDIRKTVLSFFFVFSEETKNQQVHEPIKSANTPTDYFSAFFPAEAAAKSFYFSQGEYALVFAGDATAFCKFMFLTADLYRNIIDSRISMHLPKRLTLSCPWPFLPAQSSCNTNVCSRTLSADFVLYLSRHVNLTLQCFSEVITVEVICHRRKLCLKRYYSVHSELAFSLNMFFFYTF